MDDNLNSENPLPQFLLQARVNHAVKRSVVAKTLGMHIESVRLWETGKNGIPLEKVAQVAKAYKLTEEEKEEFERLALNKPECDASEEVRLLSRLLALPKDIRQRIVKTLLAYDSPPEEK